MTQYEFVREFFTSNTISVFIDTAFVLVFLLVIYAHRRLARDHSGARFRGLHHRRPRRAAAIGKYVAASMNEASQRQALLVESISTVETIKSLQAEAYLLRKWREHSKNAANTSEKIKQLSAATANIMQFIQQLVTVALVVAGAYAFSEGEVSTGAIIATVMLAGRAVAPLGADRHHAVALPPGDAVAEGAELDHGAARGPAGHGRLRQSADPVRRA